MCELPTPQEIVETMRNGDWSAEQNAQGMWKIGPEFDGIMNVLGMGRSFIEAFQMAKRTIG